MLQVIYNIFNLSGQVIIKFYTIDSIPIFP